MGEVPSDAAADNTMSILSSKKKSKMKAIVGGPMSTEEMRMNKGLLQEISKMKKASQYCDKTTIQGHSSPANLKHSPEKDIRSDFDRK